jgi:hypothetical protein
MSMQRQYAKSKSSEEYWRKLTKPTVTKAEPVFQPTSENWLESQ